MGLNGGNLIADLTRSPHLRITSSDPDVLAIDREHAVFRGQKPGHAQIRISEATAIVQAVVTEPKASSPASSDE